MKKIIITLLIVLMSVNCIMAEENIETTETSETAQSENIENTESNDLVVISEGNNEFQNPPEEQQENLSETPENTTEIAEDTSEISEETPELADFTTSVIYNEDHTAATVIAEYLGECTELTLANEEEIMPFVEAGLYQVNMEQGDWSNKIAFDVLSNGMICLEINVWNNDTLIGTKLVKSSVIGLNNDILIFEPEQTTYEITSSDVGSSDSRNMTLSYETNVSFTWSIPTELPMADIEDDLTVTVNNSNLATETALRIRVASTNDYKLIDSVSDESLTYIITDQSSNLIKNDDVILDHIYNQDSSSNILHFDLTQMPVLSGKYEDTLCFTASVERLLDDLYSGQKVVVSDLGTTHNLTNLKIYGIGNQVQSKGLNLWDEEWELGDISNSGELVNNSTMFRSKNPINIKPDTTYYFHSDIEGVNDVFLYDDSMNLVQLIRSADVKNKPFVTPSNVKYLKFYNTGQTYYDGGIAIIEGTNGKYEPYTGGVPAPSPDNPSEIQSVVNPKLSLSEINVFDYEKYITSSSYTENGYTVRNYQLEPNTKYYLKNIARKYNENVGIWLLQAKDLEINVSGYIGLTANYQNIESFTTKQDGIIKIGYVSGNKDAIDENYLKDNLIISTNEIVTDVFVPFKGYQTATLPYTLNAIPVDEGGNVTIDGQQYIADYVDIENKKLVRNVYVANDLVIESIDNTWYVNTESYPMPSGIYNGGGANSGAYCTHFIQRNNSELISSNDGFSVYQYNGNNYIRIYITGYMDSIDNAQSWLNANDVKIYYVLETPTITNLTDAEVQAFKDLYTYSPTTAVSASSEQLTPYIEFGLS